LTTPPLCVILAGVNSCADLVDVALELKRKAAREYAEYASRAGKPDLKPLMVSLSALETEHAEILGEIKRRGDLDLLFRSADGPMPGEPSAPPATPDRPTSELLAQALRNTDASIEVLSFLEAHATDAGVSGLLRRLADEARRTRVMVASRHDLETLGGA
jgi:rubrerythrin